MIIVLADDFSGAAEVAGVAHRFGLRAEVQTRLACDDQDCIVLDTDTRSLPPEDAARRVSEIARAVAGVRPSWIYNKIDSVLRGPVLAEVEAIADVFQKRSAWIVNSNPRHGRTVVEGCLRVDGVPVDQTFFADDPEHPRTCCSAEKLLRLSTKRSTRAVPPLSGTGSSDVSHTSGPTRTSHTIFSGRVGGLSAAGQVDRSSRGPAVTTTVCDVRSSEDLHRLAETVAEDALLCGGAEFFDALLERRLGQRSRRAFAPLCIGQGQIVVCGSSVGSLCTQPDGKDALTLIQVVPGADCVQQVIDLIQSGHTVGVSAGGINEGEMGSEMTNAQRTCAIAEVVRGAVETGLLKQVLVEGGRTASTIARACGWQRLIVGETYAEGVVGATPHDDPSLNVVVKPGSYRWPVSVSPSNDSEAA